MTFYDSSLIIEYLDGTDEAVAYVDAHVDERAVTIPLVLFEVYLGEVYKSGPADFASVDGALEWLTVVPATADLARAASELQDELHRRGEPLSPRDAFIAGAADGLGERLVTADTDFDIASLTGILQVDLV